MPVDGSLIFDTEVDTTGVEKGVKEINTTFGELVGANLMSNALTSVFQEATTAIGSFVKQGVTLASDLQEVQNVVDTTFGDGAAQIYAWADAAAESFGMSSLSAQQYNGTMGAMLKSMGLADDAVIKMSTDMVGLAGDMASFYNLDIEQAFEKIRSGISGETEPLKQLGINMSVANLEAFALAEGIEKAYSAMSQSEQAQLRYSYLMSVTADAQGDFAKTSDSFANQQRILRLQVDNLAASLGEKLLPHLNDAVGTVIDKLPQAERSIENIGEILGAATSFALEHHEAIISLVTAYGTFYGVMKAGTAIQTAVTSIKMLTTATESAKTAQLGMNAAVAANPYVLLASAIAAVTVGLVTYANTIDSVHNKVKDINNDVKELKNNTEDSIAASEGEIAVIENKAAKYEELRQKLNRTAGEEEQLMKLAEELQQYMPEGTQLIDKQTGAYNSLADSIDSVTEAMRRKAKISVYEDEYEKLITKQREAKKIVEEMEKRKEETGRYLENSVKNPALEINADIAAYENAKNSLDGIVKEIEALDMEISSLYEESTSFTPSNTPTNGAAIAAQAYGETMTKINQENAEKLAEQQKKNTEKMQKAWEDAEYAYSTGAIASEQALYDKKREIWNKYGDSSVRDHRKYYTEICDYDKSFAEQVAADEEQAIRDKWDNINRLNQMGLLTDAEAMAERKKFLEDYYPEYSAESHEYYKQIYDDENKIAAESLAEQEDIVDDGLSAIVKRYQEAYKELDRKRQEYRNKLMSVGGDLFSVDVTEENGKKTTTYTVNNLDEQLRKMREYHRQVKALKDQNASEGLLNELTSMGTEDSMQFAKYLSGMSAAEFAKINDLYNEKQKLADDLSQDLYKSEAQSISESMTDALAELATSAYDYGAQTAQQFTAGFNAAMDELGVGVLYNQIQASGATKTYENYVVNGNQNGTQDLSISVDVTGKSNVYLDGKLVGEQITNYQGKERKKKGT